MMEPIPANRTLARDRPRLDPRALIAPVVRHGIVPITPAACGPTAFAILLTAIVLQMSVSANLLFLAGVCYDVPGGFPLFKLHPATYLAALAMLLVLLAHGQPVRQLAQVASIRSGLVVYIAAMLFCTASQVLSVGVSGAAIMIESYVAPWTVAVVLAACTRRQLAIVATVFIAMVVLNAGLGLFEAVLKLHLMPAFVAGRELQDLKGEFRPYALFDHPLTAAMATMMGIFVLLSTAIHPTLKALTGAVMLLGLLAWGGRTALAATCIILGWLGAVPLARATLARTLSLTLAVATMVMLAAGLAAIWFVTTQTPIGERVLSRLYLDDSASSRLLQFRVLGLLDFDEAVMGVDSTQLADLAYRLSLVSPFEEIENPWLLAYLHLGVCGFLVFTAGLIAMIRHLWQAGAFYGRVIVVGLFLVASMSNSLGRKSNVLFLMVVAVYAAGRATTTAAGSQRHVD